MTSVDPPIEVGLPDKLLLSYMRTSPLPIGKSSVQRRLRSRLVTGTTTFRQSNGLTYHLDLSDHVMRELFINGVYERNTQRHLLRLLEPSMTFLDVGANIGSYTVPMANHLRGGKVHAFEPNPRAAQLLRKNITASGLENIKVHEIGLSDRQTQGIINSGSLTTASLHKHFDSADKSTIELTSLDEFLATHGFHDVDAMKIDVEGHEMKVLEGAQDFLSSVNRMMLIVEIDDNCKHAGYTRTELFDHVLRFGFRAFLPRAWPMKLQATASVPDGYTDNVIFLKGDW